MEKAQQEVAESGHGLGSFAGTTGILSQRHISLVVKPVLNRPMTAADAG